MVTLNDKKIIRNITVVKQRLRELSQKAKINPHPCHDSSQKKLLRLRNHYFIQYYALIGRLQEPSRFKEKTRIYDI